jgi:hypothetical protein
MNKEARMSERPHNIADLYLAPVALAIDTRLTEMAALDEEHLAVRVGLASDEADWTVELRRNALLRAVGQRIELHGWTLTWDDRGVRISHGEHSVVLGAPANFRQYVEGAGADSASWT